MTNWILDYWDAIQNRTVNVGQWVRKAYRMIVDGLATGAYIYRPKKADKVIRFIENFCHHSEGRSDLIRLELWQKAAVSVIFGVYGHDGLRQFREVFIVVARKNGKSLLASAIMAYMAYMDNEYGAKLYCIAPKLDQAEKVFDGFWQMVQAEPELMNVSKKRRSDIYIRDTNTSIKPIAFNYKKSDGFNPSFVSCDEMAAWPPAGGLKQYEVFSSAFGARKQPVIFSISTSGYINDGPYDELMKRSTAVLKGSSREKRLFPLLYMVDDESKWNTREELEKSNPNLDVSVPWSFYEEEIAKAESSTPKLAEFKCKYCNIKQNSSVAWLDYDVVSQAMSSRKIEEFERHYAVAGIDLSQTTDLTCASVVIQDNGILYAFAKFFMPAGKLEKNQTTDGVPYDIYERQGLLQLSGENVVDYDDVYRWFCYLRDKLHIYIQITGYDRWSAIQLVNQMKSNAFRMDDVFQGENLSPVIKEFEGILRDGNFKIAGDNHLLQAHFLNVALKQNMETRKVRPVKIEERSRIDGFVSVIDAMTVRQKWWEELGYLLANPRFTKKAQEGDE